MLLTAAFVSMFLLLPSVAMQFVELGQANPFYPDGYPLTKVEWKEEGVIPPPEDTLPPVISVASPQNNTAYASNNVSLTLNVSMPLSTHVYLPLTEVYCVVSWRGANNKMRFVMPEGSKTQASISLNDVPEGSHWLQVHAVASAVAYVTDRKTEVGYVYQTSPILTERRKIETTTLYYVSYKINSSAIVKFAIDKTAPNILSVSVENKTYSTSDVPLDVIVSEPVSEVIYSLDGQGNRTVAGNATLNDLSSGMHTLAVSVLDSAGNGGSLETVQFSVDEPFPVMPVATASAASVAVISIILFIYFKKHKHEH
jgi:hypothetical protein